jgi:hypothetical protein
MKSGFNAIAVAILLFSGVTRAQVVQDSWIAPSEPNFSSSLTVRDLYELRWYPNLTGWFPTYAADADVSNVDLWVTDYNLHTHSHLIAGKFSKPVCVQAR